MSKTKEDYISKKLSFILRHKMEDLNIPHINGSASIDDIIEQLNLNIKNKEDIISISEIENLIENDTKNRFSLTKEGFIKANYGHSFNVDNSFLNNNTTPKKLFFYAKNDIKDEILSHGFKNLNKNHQYLYDDYQVAIDNKNQNKTLTLFVVDTNLTKEVEFNQITNHVWITEHLIPAISISVYSKPKSKDKLKFS